MIDRGRVTSFDWDEGNARKNLVHNVTQAEAEQVFFNKQMVANDLAHSSKEPRWNLLGVTNLGRLLHVTFTLRERGTKIRIISARDMSRGERSVYKKNSKAKGA
jgi:uncharacterized DUF497 family protein